MKFTSLHDHDGGSAKAGKFAIVAALHVLVAVGFIKSIDGKKLALPKVMEDVTVLLKPEIPPPPPPPPEPPKPMPKVAPPKVIVPPVEVEAPPPEIEPPVQAVEAEPAPTPPATPSQAEGPPSQSSSPGNIGTVSLADAQGCATPEYPARAARDGESGTVTLALLIGPDGRVQSTRVQSSSGSRELDRAAVNALALCRFKPAMADGVAQAGWAQLAYVWKLED